MSVPASGNVTLTGINTVFGKATGFSLASYASSNTYDVTTGTGSTLALPITMRSSFLNKTPLGKVAKPTIVVTENATVAAGTLTNCVSISWSAPTGATPTGYTVEVSTDGTTFTVLSNPTSTSITHTPTANQSYWYRVRAKTTGAVGAWSSNSGVAVFPYSSSPIAFTPPVLATFTMIGAAGGKGAATNYPVAQTYGTRVTGLAFNDAWQTRIAFGGAGGSGTAGAGITTFSFGNNTWSGGAGGAGWNVNAGGGGGASIIVTSGSGYLIVGGAGGGGDSGKSYGRVGGQAGNVWMPWTGYSMAQAPGSDGGWAATAGAAAKGGSISGGGAGGQGANRNAPAGGSGTGYALGAGGNGTSDNATAGGGGGGGWNGGGGGACAENQPGWSGYYESGGGAGGMSLMSQVGIFTYIYPNPATSTIVSYPCSGWAFSTW